MKFLDLNMLFLIWIVPALAVVYYYGYRRRQRILETFASARTRALITPRGLSGRRQWRAVLVLTGLVCLVGALAGPQYGFKWQTIEQRGVDIIIALDCSRSMLAQDIQPTRLDRAKREIYDLLTMLQGDRIGLAAFSGTAFMQCPLTLDAQAFFLFLDVLTPDYLPVGGTNLTAAVQTAAEGFDPRSQAEKAIILITDGGHTGPDDPMKAVQAAQKAGIKLFCIGVGSDQGVPIPASKGGFAKDQNNQIVLARLDEALLTRMASSTGGTYVRSVAGDMDLEAIYRDQIRGKMEQAVVEGGRKQVWANRYQWPLLLAVLLLLAGWWIPAAKGVRLPVVILLSAMIPTAMAHAGPVADGYRAYEQGQYEEALKRYIDGQLKDPDNPELLYNIGNAYYKNGDFQAAENHFRRSLETADPKLTPRLHYNLGNSAFRQGKLEEAIDHYQKAIDLAPDDVQAKENLEFVKRQLQQQQKSSKGQDDTSKEDNQDAQDSDGQTNPNQGQQSHGNEQGEQRLSQGDQEQPSQAGAPEKNQPGSSPEQQEQQNQAAEQSMPQPKQQSPSAADQVLQRLKDEPGRALMPNYQKRHVKEDW